MSLKIRTFAGKWRDVILLLGLLSTCAIVLISASRWTGKQEEIIVDIRENNLKLETRINAIEIRGITRDSLISKATINLDKLTGVVNQMIERQNNWESEHIKLMKMHNLYPNKLYRGEGK